MNNDFLKRKQDAMYMLMHDDPDHVIPFSELDEDLRNDRELVEYAISVKSARYRPLLMPHVGKRLLEDKEFVLTAFKNELVRPVWEVLSDNMKKEIMSEEVVRETVYKEAPDSVSYLPESIKNDPVAMGKIIRKNLLTAKYMGERLKNDENFLNDIADDNMAHQFVFEQVCGDSLKTEIGKNKDRLLEKIRYAPSLLNYTDDSLKNEQFYLDAISKNAECFDYLPIKYYDNKKFIIKAINANPHIFEATYYKRLGTNDMRYRLLNDKKVVLAGVKNKGAVLEYVDKQHRANKKIVLEAIKANSSAIHYADPKYRENIKFLSKVIAKIPHVWGELRGKSYASLKDRNKLETVYEKAVNSITKEKTIEIVSKDGLSLAWYEKWQNDKDVVLAALRNRSEAFQFASDELRNDKEFILSCCKDGVYPSFIGPKALNDKEVAITLLQKEAIGFLQLGEEMKKDDEIRKMVGLSSLSEVKEQDAVEVSVNKNKKSRKMQGNYDNAPEEVKASYDAVMKKSFTKILNTLTAEQVAYLNALFKDACKDIDTNDMTPEYGRVYAVYTKVNNRYNKLLKLNQQVLEETQEEEQIKKAKETISKMM